MSDTTQQPRTRGNLGPDTPKYYPSGAPKRQPRTLERSRHHGVMVPWCPECVGPILREDHGGPVILHAYGCSMPPRPQSWRKTGAGCYNTGE
jgi:hypothetical protein